MEFKFKCSSHLWEKPTQVKSKLKQIQKGKMGKICQANLGYWLLLTPKCLVMIWEIKAWFYEFMHHKKVLMAHGIPVNKHAIVQGLCKDL